MTTLTLIYSSFSLVSTAAIAILLLSSLQLACNLRASQLEFRVCHLGL